MNSSETSFVTTNELAPNLLIRFITDADDAGMGYLANFVAGSTTFISVTSIGSVISGAHLSYYSFTFQAACKVIRSYEPGELNGSATAGWELVPTYDSVWQQTLQIDVVNTLAA
jgi:hypothetical protein